MEIQALRYVVTLAEELHFGRAARRHFISAQPFGQTVQRLEGERCEMRWACNSPACPCSIATST